MKIDIREVVYHRNGITGTGFHVVLFKRGRDLMIATVFPDRGDVAVLDVAETSRGNIGEGNKWRGDHFETELREAIAKHDAAERPAPTRAPATGRLVTYEDIPAFQVQEGDVVNGRTVRRIEITPGSGERRFRYETGPAETWKRYQRIPVVERRVK